MRKHWKAVTLAFLGLTIFVSACSSNRVDVIEAPLADAPNMRPLPVDLARPCPPPSGEVGQDARSALARTRGALAICSDRHGNTVKFYNDVRQVVNNTR